MADPIITPTTPRDIEEILPLLRKEDIRECHSISGIEPRKALYMGLLTSKRTYTLRDADGTIAGITGVVPMSPKGVAAVWLLGTTLIQSKPVTFIRHSKLCIDTLFNEFHTLVNVADSRNEVHLRWLRFMGFSLIRRVPGYGVDGSEVVEFARINSNV